MACEDKAEAPKSLLIGLVQSTHEFGNIDDLLFLWSRTEAKALRAQLDGRGPMPKTRMSSSIGHRAAAFVNLH
jgi:hypothetical protein